MCKTTPDMAKNINNKGCYENDSNIRIKHFWARNRNTLYVHTENVSLKNKNKS